MDAISYLQQFVQQRLDLNEQNSAVRALNPFDHLEIKGLIHGLVVTSALTQADADDLMDNLLNEPATAAGAVDLPPSLRSGAVAHATPVDPARHTAAPPPVRQNQPVPQPLRIIPLLRECRDEAATMTLLSLEVWTSMIAVRAAYSASDLPHGEIIRQQTLWTATDNSGGRYHEIGRVNSDVQDILLSTRFLAPGTAAETLTLLIDGIEATIAQNLPLR